MTNRKQLLRAAAALPVIGPIGATAASDSARVRPGQPGWPTEAEWQQFGARLSSGALVPVRSPWPGCTASPAGDECNRLFQQAKNPYFLGDEAAMTQTLGWVGAWTSSPSAYAVAAKNADDIAAAVNFARERRLRLAVKGGGHTYQGTANAPDSLLVWTRRMNQVTLHENFTPQGCAGATPAARAVSVGAGAVWAHA